MRLQAGIAALGFSFLLVLGTPVRAQDDDEYRRVITEALAEFDGHNFAEALALFRRAHALRPSARTLRGLGQVSFELRHYVDAVNYFREALASTVNPLTDAQRTESTNLMTRAEAFVGRYRITTTPEGAAITVDGNEATNEIVLDIGAHVVAASLSGYVTSTRTVNVIGGEDTTLAFVLEPATRDTVIEERVVVANDPGEPVRIAGWSIGGVGLVGLILGASFHGAGYSAYEAFRQSVEVTRACNNDGTNIPPSTGCEALFSNWHTFETLRDVFYVTGTIFTGVGIVVLIVGYVIPPETPHALTIEHGDDDARDVARGVDLVLRDDASDISIGCGPFSDLGVACSGSF